MRCPLERLELADIEAAVRTEKYLTVEGRMTICVLTLVNGFLVTGESAAVDPSAKSTAVNATV